MTDTRDIAREALDLAEKASPGPWAVNPFRAEVDAFVDRDPLPVCRMLWPTKERSEAETEANAAFIAFSREALPTLAQRVLSLEDEVKRLTEENERLMCDKITLEVSEQRLRGWAYAPDGTTYKAHYNDSATEVSRLRCALRPFAEAARLAEIGGRPPSEFVGAPDYENALALTKEDGNG